MTQKNNPWFKIDPKVAERAGRLLAIANAAKTNPTLEDLLMQLEATYRLVEDEKNDK